MFFNNLSDNNIMQEPDSNYAVHEDQATDLPEGTSHHCYFIFVVNEAILQLFMLSNYL
jgi:hypothetical protein